MGESFNMKHILGPTSKSTLTNVQEGDSQPNAVDLRLNKVFEILPTTFENLKLDGLLLEAL